MGANPRSHKIEKQEAVKTPANEDKVATIGINLYIQNEPRFPKYNFLYEGDASFLIFLN